MRKELSQFLVRGALLTGTALIPAGAIACNNPDTSAPYTIHTDAALPAADRIDQVRAATGAHRGPDYRQVDPSSTEAWAPGMAEVVQLGETPTVRRIPGLGEYNQNRAELRIVQPHILRAEDQHLYRGFIVDDQGNIVRITRTATERAEDVFAASRINAGNRRLAVVKIQIETAANVDALEIARRGLELHLETVDAEAPHPHYAYQSSTITPLNP